MSANERLRDAIIAHAFQFERLRAGLDREALSYFNRQLAPAIRDALGKRLLGIDRRGRDLGKRQTARLKRLYAEIDALATGGFAELRELVAGQLTEIGGLEAQWLRRATLEAISLPELGLELSVPAQGTIRSIVRGETIRGRLLSTWFKELGPATSRRIRAAIDSGIVSGQTTDEIVRGIVGTRRAGFADGLLNRSRNEVRAVVRTAATHVSARTRQETAEGNADVMKGWQWVSTLDTRTSLICINLDGKVWPLGETGETPPAHFNCRSSLSPVVKSWREMGIDLKQAPEGTRESLDGKVAESIKAPEWLRRQSKARQIEALGKQKAEWFRAGKLSTTQMVDATGRELSVDALRAKYGL